MTKLLRLASACAAGRVRQLHVLPSWLPRTRGANLVRLSTRSFSSDPNAQPKELEFENIVATNPEDYSQKYYYVNQGYSKRLVSLWLYGVAAMVFFMIVVGGYTRMSGSGLSMVRWKPVGYRYPQNEEEWQAEFTIYKQYPEFKAQPDMDIGHFKRIFNVEFFHRLVGNAIGSFFALPMAYFWLRGYFTPVMKRRTSILLLLGGLQGLIGWWMVQSGMGPKPNYHVKPKVSTYRLITHNVIALTLYVQLLSLAVRVGKPMRYYLRGAFDPDGLKRMKRFGMLLIHLVGFNLLTGVAVAGIDAGRVFNTWPLMNGHVVPPGIWLPELGWRNLFENLACVQFNHRNFAYLTFGSVYWAMATTWRKPLPLNLRVALLAIFGLVNLQVLLGINAVLQQVPVEAGVKHQANAILVLSVAVYLLAATRGKAIRFV